MSPSEAVSHTNRSKLTMKKLLKLKVEQATLIRADLWGKPLKFCCDTCFTYNYLLGTQTMELENTRMAFDEV